MADHKPIFFDRVRAYAYHPGEPDRLPGDMMFEPSSAGHMRDIFKRAVPFVIDDDAVQKAQEMRNEFLLNPKVPLIDIALVPFAETWIEYDPRAKFPPGEASLLTADHVGHLIVRDHATENGISVITFEGWRKNVTTLPYVMNWSTTEKLTAPWRLASADRKFHVLTERHADTVRTVFLMGEGALNPEGVTWLPRWKNRLGGDLVIPTLSDQNVQPALEQIGSYMKEGGGSLSLLMSILALIAWCPVEMTEKRPKGMFLHNRKPRAYMDHKVVHLRIPIRTAYTYIQKGMAEITRKRRHRVREHLRVYHAGTPKERRVVVHEHMRGDASLGYVRQEYEVST